VLTPDVRFEGWTTESWQRFLHLWKPRMPGGGEREATRPRGGILAVHEGGRLRKVLHTRTGRVAPSGPWPVPLATLAETNHASWAIAAHTGALEEVMERFGARIGRGDDFVRQSLTLVGIVQEMMAEGAIESWPHRLRGILPPTEMMVRRALDALCPDGRAMVLGFFKSPPPGAGASETAGTRAELWTAFAARRRGTGFDVLAGPELLTPYMGLLSGDWRRDYRHLAQAVEDLYAPVAFGCFAEVETFRELQVDARPGAWGRAVAVRDVVLSPIPVAVGMALGVDAARFAFDNLKKVSGQFAPLGFLDPVLAQVRVRLGDAAGDKDVPRVLGFDPMAALRALLRR
jgi:hypothetical protein